MIRVIAGLIFIVAITGCSTTFSCGQFPHTGCQSVSSVYDETNGNVHDYRETYSGKGFGNGKTKRYKKQPGELHIHVSETQNAMNVVDPGDMYMTRPVVRRVLLSPWKDKDGDMNAGGFIFVKLKESEWIVDEK